MIFNQIIVILKSKDFWDYVLHLEWLINLSKAKEEEKGIIEEMRDVKREITLSQLHYMLRTAVKNKADEDLIQEYSKVLADRIGVSIEEVYMSIKYTPKASKRRRIK